MTPHSSSRPLQLLSVAPHASAAPSIMPQFALYRGRHLSGGAAPGHPLVTHLSVRAAAAGRSSPVLLLGAEQSGPATPLELTTPRGGCPVYIFGAAHGDMAAPEAADFILRRRPGTVVVETALNPDHGATTGAVLRREEVLQAAAVAGRLSVEPRTLAFAQVAAQLAGGEEGGAGAAPAADSALWWDLSRSGRSGLCSEQLAYVAAFAVGAALVFGDRPKAVTYRRMLLCPSLADLDTAFGLQSASNYHALAPGLPLVGGSSLTEEVLIRERDRVLAASLRASSLVAGPGGGCVVGVVGASHLPGLQQSWDAPGFLDGAAEGDASAELTTVPASAATEETAEQAGVRRALFDGVIRLTCLADVSEDVQRELGPVAEASEEAHAWSAELYGNSRMLLAALDRGQLAEVCVGWRCDMWEVLAPLRAARPANGGTGLDVDLTVSLRALNFDLSA